MDVILVDELDRPTGTMEKMEVHRKAMLHRAFSVFIFNDNGEMLLQKRASQKYHSAGLWTNTCCSHPEPGEDTGESANKRLQQEMGFSTTLQKVFSFIYKAAFENGLTEYEFDHVFVGTFDGTINPDPAEVEEYRYQSFSSIRQSLHTHPQHFTEWFKIALPKLEEYLSSRC
jgi:isopentenyl-diphosphate Delta-isomerase